MWRGAQGPSSCWLACGQYVPVDWVKIREHGRTWPRKAASVSIPLTHGALVMEGVSLDS